MGQKRLRLHYSNVYIAVTSNNCNWYDITIFFGMLAC